MVVEQRIASRRVVQWWHHQQTNDTINIPLYSRHQSQAGSSSWIAPTWIFINKLALLSVKRTLRLEMALPTMLAVETWESSRLNCAMFGILTERSRDWRRLMQHLRNLIIFCARQIHSFQARFTRSTAVFPTDSLNSVDFLLLRNSQVHFNMPQNVACPSVYLLTICSGSASRRGKWSGAQCLLHVLGISLWNFEMNVHIRFFSPAS